MCKNIHGCALFLGLLIVASGPCHGALVLSLQFENDLLDSSGFGNHASAVGNANYMSYDTGLFGTGLRLDTGGGDRFDPAYLEIADSLSLSPSAEVTMSAWVYHCCGPNGVGQNGNNAGIFFKGALVGLQPDWQLTTAYLFGPNTTTVSTSINGTGVGTSEALVHAPGQNVVGRWTHLASTYDGNTLSVYVDGLLAGTQAWSAPLNTSGSSLYIGNRFLPSGDIGNFQGIMDNVRVYDESLTAEEIAALADVNAPVNQTPQGLVPEPSSIALLVLGLSVVGRVRFGHAAARA